MLSYLDEHGIEQDAAVAAFEVLGGVGRQRTRAYLS